jgi:hypothetical protein
MFKINFVIDGCLWAETTDDRDQGIGHLIDSKFPINFMQETSSFIVLN